MVKAESRYKKLQKKYTTKVDPIFASDSEAKNVLDSLSRGRNAYLRMDRCESAVMDNTWINTIEDCLPALEEIVMNPRRTLTTEAEVVPVEKARRTTKESVIHLSAHTEYVKEVKPNGDVIPSKILNISNEDFYQTYENRFIASLIRRLLVFVNQRYQYISEFNPLSDSQILYYKTNAIVNGENVEIETRIIKKSKNKERENFIIFTSSLNSYNTWQMPQKGLQNRLFAHPKQQEPLCKPYRHLIELLFEALHP